MMGSDHDVFVDDVADDIDDIVGGWCVVVVGGGCGGGARPRPPAHLRQHTFTHLHSWPNISATYWLPGFRYHLLRF